MSKARANLSSALTPELRVWSERIEQVARESGLDFFPLDFRLLDASDVNAVAAYGGFPVRYASWRFGMDYERLDKAHAWGLSRIYELVINTDPVIAYLVRSNLQGEQKLVMAHVCGHADFFKHNAWFAGTDRGMLDTMVRHAERVERCTERLGRERVESFLDIVLCLDNLIDPYQALRARLRRGEPQSLFPTSSLRTFDVLAYVSEHAPLEDWERELAEIVLAEARYFAPQRMTRIMNEGWASFWHSRILTGGVLSAAEIVDFAETHSGATATAPGRINPYKLGIELWRHAEARGEDLFRLRSLHNDASFVEELVDAEFVARAQLFLQPRPRRSGGSDAADRDPGRVKARLCAELAWGGVPRIELVDVGGARELRLLHHHDGRDLNVPRALETVSRVQSLWRAPVTLETRVQGSGRLLACDGAATEVRELPSPSVSERAG